MVGSGQAGQAVQPVRVAQVDEELQHLTNAVEVLEQSVAMLVPRLNNVSRSSAPRESSDNVKLVPSLCPLADQIRQQRLRIDAYSTSLIDARDRLEI